MAAFVGLAGAHRVPLGQNSLQGALVTPASGMESATASGSGAPAPAQVINLEGSKPGSRSYLDEEMQRQLHDYNRSVTIVIWHTVCILSVLSGDCIYNR